MPSGFVPERIKSRSRERQRKLVALGHRSYTAYLGSPEWERVKARYRASDLPQACMCGEADVQLHHLTYERVGQELLTDLRPLCGSCHTAMHVLERRGDIDLTLEGLESRERAERYAAELAPMIAKARWEFEAPQRRPLWQRLRDIEDKLEDRHLSSIRTRIERLERRAIGNDRLGKVPKKFVELS